MIATSLTIAATLAALLQPTLIEYTALKSVDGKHTAQLLTVGFPLRGLEGKLLGTVMNSDPYWHHFRYHKVYLRVGDKSFPGGPRLLAEGVGGSPVKAPGPRPRYGWTVTFALPGDVKLAGAELRFCGPRNHSGKAEPAADPFAGLTVPEKALRPRPLRATVKETGRFRDALDENRDRHYAIFVLNHYPPVTELRIGEAAPRRFPYDLHFGDGKGRRETLPDEWIASFTDAPPAGAAVRVKIEGLPGWYEAETAAVKPADKK